MNQPELTFPNAPIDAETRATVELVGNDWRADEDWRRFVDACEAVRYAIFKIDGSVQSTKYPAEWRVDPNDVRERLTAPDGELTINPRRLSAFYNRAAGKDGFLDFSHWGISEDHKGRNAGRPCRIYKLRSP